MKKVLRRHVIGDIILNIFCLTLGGFVIFIYMTNYFDLMKPRLEEIGAMRFETKIATVLNSGKNKHVGMFFLTKTTCGTKEHYNIDFIKDWRN